MRTVLVFCRYYLPGYKAGGPIRSVSNIVARLGSEFDFRIVAVDRDLGDVVPYPGIAQGEWRRVGKAQVMYVALALFRFDSLVRVIRGVRPDLLYLNSFFDPNFTVRVLLVRRLGLLPNARVLVAPRGEFSTGALSLKSFKKSSYIFIGKLIGLFRGLEWHVSSVEERRDLLAVLGSAHAKNVRIASNLGAYQDEQVQRRSPRLRGHALRVCFLGRISPMKNLDFALAVLERVRVPVVFTIYGPQESHAYWLECEKLIQRLPSNVSIVVAGAVAPEVVSKVLSSHDLFFFPTRGENFGHAIVEALGSGLPVLISDRTPWSDLEKEGVGWTFALDDSQIFSNKIEELSGWDEASHESVSVRARNYARRVTGDIEALRSNRALFE